MTGDEDTAGKLSSTGWATPAALALAAAGVILVFVEPRGALVAFALAVVLGLSRVLAGGAAQGLPAVVMAGSAAGSVWLLAGFAWGFLGSRTPAPPETITNPLDPAQRDAVLSYARGLTYADTVCDAFTQHDPRGGYHGQCDRNLVDTVGTVAIVSPEVNIHRSRAGDLRRGRVQLRIDIRVTRPDLDPQWIYKTLGVPPGVSYVWVDSLSTTAGGGTARAVVVPEDARFPAFEKTVRLYPGPRWNLAVARWTPGQCWSCKIAQWCSSQ